MTPCVVRLSFAVALILTACDRPAPPPSMPASAPRATLSTILTVRAGGVATLATRNGDLFVLQRGAGSTVARRYRADGSMLDLAAAVGPRAAVALGDADARPVVQAISPGGAGSVLMLLGGTHGPRSLCSLWAFTPGADTLRLLAGPDELARQSGLGSLVDLSDGQLTAVGEDLFLTLHGPGGTTFIRLDGGQLAGGVVRLSRPFTKLSTDDGPLPLETDDVWFGRADGSLNLFRPASGTAWRIDRTGHATLEPPPPGRPAASVPPLDLRPPGPARPEEARSLAFFPDTLTADAALTAPGKSDDVVRYPALVVHSDAGDTVYDRDALVTRPGFPTHALHLVAWCQDPATGDVLAYDAMSGDVLRIAFGG